MTDKEISATGVQHYRSLAADARRIAKTGLTFEVRKSYEQLAANWDELADTVEKELRSADAAGRLASSRASAENRRKSATRSTAATNPASSVFRP